MIKEFWYNEKSNVSMMNGNNESLILIEINGSGDVNNIVIYGNGKFGYSPYFIF